MNYFIKNNNLYKLPKEYPSEIVYVWKTLKYTGFEKKYHPLAYLHLKLRKNYKLYERNLIPIIGKYLLLA
mgnify:FL=1